MSESEPSDSALAKADGLTGQLKVLRQEDPQRYAAMTEGMRIVLAAIRTACDQLEQVIGNVQ